MGFDTDMALVGRLRALEGSSSEEALNALYKAAQLLADNLQVR